MSFQKAALLLWTLIFNGTFFMNFAIASPPSLDEKIGQMIMVGFDGVNSNDPGVQEITRQIKEGKIGGVIYFYYNIQSPNQIQQLTKHLKKAAKKYPLFQATDQEGGKVQRLKKLNGFKDFLSAHEIADQMSPTDAEKYYNQMAAQTANAGFNVVFGPVVDLHADPRTGKPCAVIGGINRSFSSSPEQVTQYAKAFIKGHQQHSIITASKHFPGHGFATGDSHEGMVDITNTHSPDELVPFKNLIKDGFADMIMTAHLMHRQYDEKYPATLSPVILKILLRDQLKYDGVVISDDLHMGAIQQHYSFDEIVIRAINAGCDILLFSNNRAAAKNVEKFEPSMSIALKIHAVIKKALKNGELKEEQITKSYERIIALKARL